MQIFKDRLIEYKSEFDGYFTQAVNEYLNIAGNSSKAFSVLVSELARVSLLKGAKRIRPILVFVGFELASGKKISEIKKTDIELYEDIINAAMAIEFFHTSALIHDDIIDQGMSRRGEETVEAFYRRYFSQNLKVESDLVNHYSSSAALLGGNLMHTIADKLMNKVRNEEVRNLFYGMEYDILAGQTDDCFGVGLSSLENLTQADIIRMMETKSGNYSINNPLVTGLILGSKYISKEEFENFCEIIKSVSYNMGIIFQLTDDLLGIFGSSKTGKSNVSDILEGKKTLIMYNTFLKSDDSEKIKLKSILGNKYATTEEIQWLKDLIVSYEVDQCLKMFCYELYQKVKLEVDKKLAGKPSGVFLEKMAQYLVERES